MSKVMDFIPKIHIYEINNCAGCNEVITDDYIELGLPGTEGKEVKHIALCKVCGSIAEDQGVI